MKTQSSLFKLALAVMLATSVAACSESDAEKAEDKMEELKAIGTFGKFFAGNVFETYFKKLGK